MKNVAPSENELQKDARHQWPSALVDLLDVAAQSLKGQMPEEQAERVSATVIAAIANYHGGRMFYLPKGQGLDRALRNRAIYRAYKHTRESIIELAEQHRLSEQTVYKIIEEQRALHKKGLPT